MLVGVLAGADDADAIADFADDHEEWFQARGGLRHGVPSHDTILRVLALMDPQAFGKAFSTWVEELWGQNAGKHIAIDGKRLRRSFDHARGLKAVHSVAAFASEHGIVLG